MNIGTKPTVHSPAGERQSQSLAWLFKQIARFSANASPNTTNQHNATANDLITDNQMKLLDAVLIGLGRDRC